MKTNKSRPDWYYKQSAVIPYRYKNGAPQILLITSRKKKKWIIPKGIVEIGMTAKQSALKEAQEEAGVTGKIDGAQIGKYTYEKWGNTCTVSVFAMLVDKVTKTWEEDYFRTRKWFTPKEAAKVVNNKDLSKLIQKCSKQF